MKRSIPVLLVVMSLPWVIFAGTREMAGTHPKSNEIRENLSTNSCNMQTKAVRVKDVAHMLSVMSSTSGDGVKCSPSAKHHSVTLNIEGGNVISILEEMCSQADLFWRIDKEAIFVFTKKEWNTSWSEIKAEIAANKPAWPELDPKQVERMLTKAREGKLSKKYTYGRSVDGWTFRWKVKQEGTNYVLVQHEAVIRK